MLFYCKLSTSISRFNCYMCSLARFDWMLQLFVSLFVCQMMRSILRLWFIILRANTFLVLVGDFPVEVYTSDGLATDNTGAEFTYDAASIDSISPDTGSIAGEFYMCTHILYGISCNLNQFFWIFFFFNGKLSYTAWCGSTNLLFLLRYTP